MANIKNQTLSYSNNVNPDNPVYFRLKWKGYDHTGSIPIPISELTRKDMEWLESAIREDVEQQIIEDCLDNYFDSEKRMKAEYKIKENLIESGKVKWYDMKTEKIIKPKGTFIGRWGYTYSDFVGNIEIFERISQR
tara:strand:+ start:280 stop:687 length:408 start_codon:yes stop_codon:yes gene_type:complete